MNDRLSECAACEELCTEKYCSDECRDHGENRGTPL